MKNYLIVFLLFLTSTFLSQSTQIDSLLIVANNLKNDSNKVKTLNKIADTYRKNYKYDSALTYAKKALELSKKLPAKKFEGQVYGTLGMIYTNSGDYNEAMQNHKNCLEIKLKNKDKIGVANSYNNIGDVYYQLGNYSEALVHHFKSLKIKESLADKKSIASSYNNIGSVYSALSNFNESIKYHQLSSKIREDLADKNGLSMSYNNLAINYNSLKNYDEALRYHELALNLYKETKNSKGIAVSIGNIGNCYFYLGNYTRALQNYSLSLKMREDINDKKGVAVCENNLAKTFFKLKNYAEAITYIEKAINLNKELNALSELKDNYNNKYLIQNEAGDYKDALNNYQKYIQYRDSIFNFENDKKSARAQIQYEFDKQRSINEAEYEKQKILTRSELEKQHYLLEKNQQSYLILEQQDKLKELSLTKSKSELNQSKSESLILQLAAKKDSEQKQLIIKFVIGIILLMAIVLFLIIRSLLINKKKNAIIAQNLDEKEILLKEIHHRVKNNLQVISSLLNLQSRYIKDAGALDAIKESKERINAISLLHKEIYQNDILKNINSKDYFTNLILNLQNTFDPEKKIQLNLNTEEIYLDIDALIPLGLMVNELFTNCYKYGVDQSAPAIWFSLIKKEKLITLNVKDNGKGFPANFDPEKTNSLGFKLISLFSKKIKADVIYTNDPGASVTLSFSTKSE